MLQSFLLQVFPLLISPHAWQGKSLSELQSLQGFETLMKKGGIPAIRSPQFVSADAANLPDDAWIIGVSDGTHHKAYSINLLNRHEIVNDFIGDKPIATTW